MRLYYGTTSRVAAKIRRLGMRPTPPRGTIWLSSAPGVARARARQMAAGDGGQAAVVVCEADLADLRRRRGRSAVCRRGPMVALRGAIEPQRVVEVLAVGSSCRGDAERVLTAGEVFSLLDSPSPRLRLMGVLMLSARGSAEAFDWLCTRLDDPDPRVRLAVVLALRRRGPETTELLRALGRDRDPLIRQAARRALESVPAVSA